MSYNDMYFYQACKKTMKTEHTLHDSDKFVGILLKKKQNNFIFHLLQYSTHTNVIGNIHHTSMRDVSLKNYELNVNYDYRCEQTWTDTLRHAVRRREFPVEPSLARGPAGRRARNRSRSSTAVVRLKFNGTVVRPPRAELRLETDSYARPRFGRN